MKKFGSSESMMLNPIQGRFALVPDFDTLSYRCSIMFTIHGLTYQFGVVVPKETIKKIEEIEFAFIGNGKGKKREAKAKAKIKPEKEKRKCHR